jgi:hypothetical protein
MKALIVVVFLVLIISLDVLAGKDILERPVNVACLTCLELSDSTLQALETDPRLFIRSIKDDTCLLGLIEALGSRAVTARDLKYLIALNSLCNVSDGYVSEGIGGVVSDIFTRDPLFLIRFFEKYKKPCLYSSLLDEVSAVVATSPLNERRNRIEDYRQKITGLLSSQTKRKRCSVFFEQEIVSKIDPAKFD